MIYYDLLWFIMIYYDILWFIMIYYDLLWYIMNYESCSKKLGLSSSLNLESRSHTVGEHVTIVSWLRASDRLSCRGCSLLHSLPICKVWRETVSTFFLVDSGFGTHFANSRNQGTYRSYRFCFVADWYGIRVLVAFIGLAYTCMYQNREPRKASNAQFSIDDCPNGHWSGDFILPVMVPFGNLT